MGAAARAGRGGGRAVTRFGPVGTPGRVGQQRAGSKRGVNQKDTIKGLGCGFELGLLPRQPVRACIAFWSLSQAAAAAGPL